MSAHAHVPAHAAEATHPARRPRSSDGAFGFIPQVEGLRALAILLVVAFHAELPGVTGGFIGVDVFFVLSGFLITGLLVAELRRTGTVSLRGFFARRARRLLPAAAVVTVATAAAMPFFFSDLRVFRSTYDLMAAVFYAANWRFVAQQQDYLATGRAESPALHFWSLSVEEQFYIVWPLLLLASWALARRWRRRPLVVLTAGVTIVTLASFAASWLTTQSDPSLAYLATHTRVWQFGCGALVALAYARITRDGWTDSPGGVLDSLVATAAGWSGLVALVVGALAVDRSTAYPGTAALLPTLGTALILAALLFPRSPSWPLDRVLTTAPMMWLGGLSYSWYLWHWPVLVLARAAAPSLTLAQRCGLMVLALGLAWVTRTLVERPAMRARTLRLRPVASAALGVLAVSCATLSLLTTGSAAVARMSTTAKHVDASAVFGPQTRDAGAVTPAPVKAGEDVPTPKTCLLDRGETLPPECRFGPATGTPVVLFGDSHANQWMSPVRSIATARGWRLTVQTKAGCPVPAYAPRNDGSRMSRPDCTRWRERAFVDIEQMRPKIVIVSALDSYVPSRDEVRDRWFEAIERLEGTGARIVYLSDTPHPKADVPECVSGALEHWSSCAFDRVERVDDVVRAVAKGELERVGAVTLNPLLCPQVTRCPAVRGGVLLYRDDSHLTDTVARLLTPELTRQLDAAVAPQPDSSSGT